MSPALLITSQKFPHAVKCHEACLLFVLCHFSGSRTLSPRFKLLFLLKLVLHWQRIAFHFYPPAIVIQFSWQHTPKRTPFPLWVFMAVLKNHMAAKGADGFLCVPSIPFIHVFILLPAQHDCFVVYFTIKQYDIHIFVLQGCFGCWRSFLLSHRCETDFCMT